MNAKTERRIRDIEELAMNAKTERRIRDIEELAMNAETELGVRDIEELDDDVSCFKLVLDKNDDVYEYHVPCLKLAMNAETELGVRDIEELAMNAETELGVRYIEELETSPLLPLQKHIRKTSKDQVDSKTRDPVNIAVAIFRDDVDSLKLVIGEMKDLKGLSLRILEAVEFNSLKCLECLCERLEQRLRPRGKKLSHDDILHHRRFKLNWPLSTVSKDSPLHLIAARCSAVKAMEIFEKYPKVLDLFVDLPNDDDSTPLLIAIRKSNISVALRLINNDTKIPGFITKNKFGESPVFLAALHGQTEIIEDMLDYKKCKMTAKVLGEMLKGVPHDLYGNKHTILYPASQSKNPKLLEVLMNLDTASDLLEVERSHSDWVSFVCNVCASGCEALVVKILELDKHASEKNGNDAESYPLFKELKDSIGATPLMRAAEAGKVNIVEQIISKDGTELISTTDNEERNIFHYALEHEDVVQYLLELHKYGPITVEVVNKKDKDGCTPLQHAAKKEFTERRTLKQVSFPQKQLGRKLSVMQYLTPNRSDGIVVPLCE